MNDSCDGCLLPAMVVNEAVFTSAHLPVLAPSYVSMFLCVCSHLAALSVLFGLGVAYLHANRTICKQVSRGVSGQVCMLQGCWCHAGLARFHSTIEPTKSLFLI